jgi:hypothetical protein
MMALLALLGLLCLSFVSSLFAGGMALRGVHRSDVMIAFLAALPLPTMIALFPLWFLSGNGPFTMSQCGWEGCPIGVYLAVLLLFVCLVVLALGMIWGWLTIRWVKRRFLRSRTGAVQ